VKKIQKDIFFFPVVTVESKKRPENQVSSVYTELEVGENAEGMTG
jgi:hypothetical protein